MMRVCSSVPYIYLELIWSNVMHMQAPQGNIHLELENLITLTHLDVVTYMYVNPYPSHKGSYVDVVTYVNPYPSHKGSYVDVHMKPFSKYICL